MAYKKWIEIQINDVVPAITPGGQLRVQGKTTTRGHVHVYGVDVVTGEDATGGGNSDSSVEVIR